MGAIFKNAAERGVLRTLALALKRVRRYAAMPLWYLCQRTSIHGSATGSSSDLEQAGRVLQQKEEFLRVLLMQNKGKKFLEIGIGEFPNVERIRLMNDNNIGYTACDFTTVCDKHREELLLKGVDLHNLRFAGNRVGSYSWTLFEMLSRNERFDLVYLDGHHTFYVDLPAFVLAHQLLEPGGYFVIDDIQWTLEFLKETMSRSYDDWRFYKDIYNFAEYETEQQKMPHMKMIVEQILLKELGYRKVEEYSIPEWWVLQKPAAE